MKISKLTPMENGNYAIMIDGKIFGEISANPNTAFAVNEVYNKITNKPLVLPIGKHVIDYAGSKLAIEVKELFLRFWAADDEFNSFKESKKTNMTMLEYKRTVEENNKKAMAELLDRVVVSEIR